MKDRHWNALVTSIRHGQCILVLGPEIPAGTIGAPADAAARSLVEALTGELAAELEGDNRRVTGTTLAAVSQQYEDAEDFGPSALRALAGKFYKSPQFVPSQVHADLAALPFSLILTTCQDDLLVRALQAAGKDPIVGRYHLRGDLRDNPEFLLPSSPTAPLVYHLFGDAQEPGSLVLSENDLLDFQINIVSKLPLPNSLVRALKRARQSFLFIGFGITQWYLRVLLKVLVRTLLELHRPGSAFATEPLRGLSEVDREQTILFYQRGTRVELEDKDTGAFLTELLERLDAAGGFAEQAALTGPRPRVFISYAREDRDLAARVVDALHRANFDPWWDEDGLSGGELWDERVRDELEATDFTLVFYSPALCRKTDGYVNKEIALARDRDLKIRGNFLIPLRTAEISDEDRIAELSKYHEMPVRPTHFDEDMADVISSMRRDLQLRHRP